MIAWVVVLGLLLACVASALFAVGVSIQALDARNAPAEHGLRVSLLRRLVRRPRWLFGTWLAASGWPFHLVALLFAPLTVVQPALASGLLLLLALGDRMLDERVGPREIVGVVAIIAGVGGMALAAPGHVSSHAGADRIGPALGLLALVAASPYLLRGRAIASSMAVPVAAGCAFAFTGIASKLVADFISDGSTLPMIGWLFAIGAMAVVGLLSEMSALQSRPATQVAPIVFTVQITLPVVLAPVLGGESWSGTPLGGGVLVVFLAAVAAGAWILGSTRAVSGLVGARTEGAVDDAVLPGPSSD
jgi:drug/metabolite transporter (DMT)-like permease